MLQKKKKKKSSFIKTRLTTRSRGPAPFRRPASDAALGLLSVTGAFNFRVTWAWREVTGSSFLGADVLRIPRE